MAPDHLCLGKKSFGPGGCDQRTSIQPFLEQVPQSQNPEFPAQTALLLEGFSLKCDPRVDSAPRCGFQAQGLAKGLLVAGVWTSLNMWALATGVRDRPEDYSMQ